MKATAIHPAEVFPKYLQNPQVFLLLSFSPLNFFPIHLASLGQAAGRGKQCCSMETTEPGGADSLARQRQSAAPLLSLAAFLGLSLMSLNGSLKGMESLFFFFCKCNRDFHSIFSHTNCILIK